MYLFISWALSVIYGFGVLLSSIIIFSSLGIFLDWMLSSEVRSKLGSLAIPFIVAVILILGIASSIPMHHLVYGTP